MCPRVLAATSQEPLITKVQQTFESIPQFLPYRCAEGAEYLLHDKLGSVAQLVAVDEPKRIGCSKDGDNESRKEN
jgi:hypothetical protein